MKQVTVFQTNDGKTFNSREEAYEHEQNVTNKTCNDLKDFINGESAPQVLKDFMCKLVDSRRGMIGDIMNH